MTHEFDSVSLAALNAADAGSLDALPFGVIGFAGNGLVTRYNACESKSAGLRAANVLGRHLFDEVAPCMNNFMVAQRFADEAEAGLDATVDYVLTLRMRPTPVRLRLLAGAGSATRFVLVERKAAQ